MSNYIPMTGYTKLFGSILTSTIWRESKETKVLWITMLALANKDGVVEASIPGLAHVANLTLEECQSGLAAMESPDPYSRTKEHEGRRIETIDGGWQILNYLKYRDKFSNIQRREYFKLKKREYRKMSTECPQCPPMSTKPSAYASDSVPLEGGEGGNPGAPPMPKANFMALGMAPGWTDEFKDYWWNTLDSTGWKDRNGLLIVKVEAFLASKWPAWQANRVRSHARQKPSNIPMIAP